MKKRQKTKDKRQKIRNRVVVFPWEKDKILIANIEQFMQLNIGVLVTDTFSNRSKRIYQPKRKNKCQSGKCYFYNSSKREAKKTK